MTRVTLVAVAAAALVFAAAAHASGHNATGFSWNASSRWLQTCNDEESTYVGACVTDPLSCTWGDEDDVADTSYGKLSGGQSTSDTLCLVTDTCSDYACPHYIDLYAQGGTGLTVTLTSNRGDVYQVPYVASAKQYQLCVRDPHYTGDRNPLDYPLLAPPFVPGSYGVLTYWTVTVTASKTTQFSGGLEIAQNFADGRYGYWHQFTNVPCAWAIP